jgi:hypothetical protein
VSLLRYGQDPRYGGGELSVHRHPRVAAAAFVHGPAYSSCREVLGGYWRRCGSREIDRRFGEMSEINNEADLALNLGVRRRRSSCAVRAPNPPGAYPTLSPNKQHTPTFSRPVRPAAAPQEHKQACSLPQYRHSTPRRPYLPSAPVARSPVVRGGAGATGIGIHGPS